MKLLQIIIAVIAMAQISVGLPLSPSFADDNINDDVLTGTSEGSKDLQPQTAQVQPTLDESLNLEPEREEKIQLIMPTLQLNNDFGYLPLADSKEIPSSLPDVAQMQRDQFVNLAMAQLMQFTRSLLQQSESKFSDILNDFGNIENNDAATAPEFLVKPKENIANYLQQLKDYKVDSSNFMARTINIPLEFQNLLTELKANAREYFDVEQILQQNNLSNFEMDWERYLENFKNQFHQQFNRLLQDLESMGQEAEDKVMQLFHDLVRDDELQMQVEKFSQIFRMY